MKPQFLLLTSAIFYGVTASSASPPDNANIQSNLLMGNRLSRIRAAERRLKRADNNLNMTNIFSPISTESAPESFKKIVHPYKSPYANESFEAIIPTNSWI